MKSQTVYACTIAGGRAGVRGWREQRGFHIGQGEDSSTWGHFSRWFCCLGVFGPERQLCPSPVVLRIDWSQLLLRVTGSFHLDSTINRLPQMRRLLLVRLACNAGDAAAPLWAETMSLHLHVLAALKGQLAAFLPIGDNFFYGKAGLPRCAWETFEQGLDYRIWSEHRLLCSWTDRSGDLDHACIQINAQAEFPCTTTSAPGLKSVLAAATRHCLLHLLLLSLSVLQKGSSRSMLVVLEG